MRVAPALFLLALMLRSSLGMVRAADRCSALFPVDIITRDAL